MSDREESSPGRGPAIEDFLGEATHDLEDWRWLWDGDHRFPLRSHRPFLGRVVVAFKRLFRPLVTAPQSDLWDRQKAFNRVVISHLREIYRLPGRLDELGQDLQQVQREILDDLRGFQSEYQRDTEDVTGRLRHLESFKRDGFDDVMKHTDALFSRVDQKLDRLRRKVEELTGEISGERR